MHIKKTTIRLTEEDEKLLEQLGKALAFKFGKAEIVSQSDVIRYSIRLVAAKELGTQTPESQVNNDG